VSRSRFSRMGVGWRRAARNRGEAHRTGRGTRWHAVGLTIRRIVRHHPTTGCGAFGRTGGGTRWASRSGGSFGTTLRPVAGRLVGWRRAAVHRGEAHRTGRGTRDVIARRESSRRTRPPKHGTCVMILLHGPTRRRAEQALQEGPGTRFQEPGGQAWCDGFSMCLEAGPLFLFWHTRRIRSRQSSGVPRRGRSGFPGTGCPGRHHCEGD